MSWDSELRKMRRALLLQTLMETGFNVAEAARRLEVHYNTVGYLCKTLDIDVTWFRENFQRIERNLGDIVTAEETKLHSQSVVFARNTSRGETYCMERINGILCHARIPLGTTLCKACEERIKNPPAASRQPGPPTGPER